MTPSAFQEESRPPGWDHISETITMLYLAVCQIETSVCDSNKSVAHLTSSFTQLAEHSMALNQRIQALPDSSDLETIKRETADTSSEMQANINESIEAFQFYDRISQRLDHVARGLERMCDIVCEQDKREDPQCWQQIQNEVRSSYSMEAEKIMFEYILKGASVKEALAIYHEHFDNSSNDSGASDSDEVVLF